jgi:hypothetical protein
MRHGFLRAARPASPAREQHVVKPDDWTMNAMRDHHRWYKAVCVCMDVCMDVWTTVRTYICPLPISDTNCYHRTRRTGLGERLLPG